MGQRCSDTRGITFEDVVVKKENVLIGEVSFNEYIYKMIIIAYIYREPVSKLPWELLTKPGHLWLQELSA